MRISDWSSDVCSSDLPAAVPDRARRPAGRLPHLRPGLSSVQAAGNPAPRSGEMNMKKTISLLGLPLLAIATMPLAQAEVQGVAPLLKQARYWQSKGRGDLARSEEHTSELQSLMRSSYAVFCLKKKKNQRIKTLQSE